MDHSFSTQAASGGRPPARSDRGWTANHAVRAAAPAREGDGAASRTASERPGWRVLVVDDNEDAAAMLSMLLQMSGHTTRIAHDGPQAVAAADEFRPDAVLLDIGLPGFDGHEVARRLRRQPWGRDLLLMAVTGWGQLPDRQASSDAGFDAHLVKPVDPDALLLSLDQRLGQRRTRSEDAPGSGAGGNG